MHKRIILIALLAFFFINPGVGCGPSSFQFGDAEMRAAVGGRWRISWRGSDGTSSFVVVDILGASAESDSGVDTASRSGARRSLIRSAMACEFRSYMLRAAFACEDATRMDLRVLYIDGDSVYQNGPTDVLFAVYGLDFRVGYLTLAFGATTADLAIRPDGTVNSAQGTLNGMSSSQVVVTASRLSP
jgi:hypothetical protein